MNVAVIAALGALALLLPEPALSQVTPAAAAPRTLAVVIAHPDDEVAVSPILARYAREGARIQLIIASDGAAGAGPGQPGSIARPEGTVPGADLARQRGEEARCATDVLGANQPVLLGFPEGKLGDYLANRTLLYAVTQRIADELARLRPDAVVTWGPDGGGGHPDHRLVSSIVTQLQRHGAPSVPERLFYMNLPVEGMRAMNPQRGEPPLMAPPARYFTFRVQFTPEDLQAAERAAACQRSQFTPEAARMMAPIMAAAWNGAISLIPAFPTEPGVDLFR